MTITSEISTNNIVYDRFFDLSLNLPYSFDDIKIQINDTVTSQLLNLKLKHLYDNFLYLYKNTKVASNLIPLQSLGTLGLSSNSTNFTWNYNLSTSQYISLSSYSTHISDTKAMFALKNDDLNNYALFVSNGNTLYWYNSQIDNSSIYLVLSTNTYIQEFNTSVTFNNIVSIIEGPRRTLLILDAGNNTLYQYDASGLYEYNTVLNNKLVFLNMIGGFGGVLDKLSFNNPQDLCTYDSKIYVLDSFNKCIKIYDENLSWLETIRLLRDFNTSVPKKIKTDLKGNFYVLLENNLIYVYDNNFKNKKIISLSETFINSNEQAIDLVFSKSNTNIFYIITKENVYKRFVTEPEHNIGNYLFYRFNYNTQQTLSAFCSFKNNTDDFNIIFSKNDASKIAIFNSFQDNENLYDILTIPDFDVYTYGEISIKSEEYVQNWVLNKTISKIIVNLMRLRDQIIGKFLFANDSRNNVVFKFTRYLTAKEKENIFFESDISYLLGQNEVITNSSINRCFKKIFDIQQNLANILQADIDKSSKSVIYIG